MSSWVAHASIYSTRGVDPEAVIRLRGKFAARAGTVVIPVSGGVSVQLPVTADHRMAAYTEAVTVLATEILPGLEPAYLTDLHIVDVGVH